MTSSRIMRAGEVRARLAFDVERLRVAATRMEIVDAKLCELKSKLESRARVLASEAMAIGAEHVSIQRAQAHATAHLAVRAALGEVLRSSSRMSLIAAMAVRRWISALRGLSTGRASETMIRSHVEVGRLAHRVLAIYRPKGELRSGVGQLTSAVVVAEFAHALNDDDVAEQIEIGLARARAARGVRSEEDALAAASRALRAAAQLLEEMADSAEPAAEALLREADGVEKHIAEELERAAQS